MRAYGYQDLSRNIPNDGGASPTNVIYHSLESYRPESANSRGAASRLSSGEGFASRRQCASMQPVLTDSAPYLPALVASSYSLKPIGGSRVRTHPGVADGDERPDKIRKVHEMGTH
jgi:hypothetical protein